MFDILSIIEIFILVPSGENQNHEKTPLDTRVDNSG